MDLALVKTLQIQALLLFVDCHALPLAMLAMTAWV